MDKPHAKVVVVTNLTRNVVEAHLQTIFNFYGEITKIDLPLFGKCTLTIPLYFAFPLTLLLKLDKTVAKRPSNS